MKKAIGIIIACVLVIGIGAVACGGNSNVSVEGGGADSQAEEVDLTKLKVGQTANLDGLKVTVTKIKTGLKDYDGSKNSCVAVKIVNDTEDEVSFNEWEWKAEDKNGVQRDLAFYGKAKNSLNSGELSPGGKVSGNIYFEGTAKKVIYEPSIFGVDEVVWSKKK